MKLWEFNEKDPDGKPLRWHLIEGGFQSKYGEVIAEFDGGFGTIYTLDLGEHQSFGRYIIAKTPKITARMNSEDVKAKIVRFLHEINETYKYANHPLIARHFDVRICAGAPFVLSRKWDLTLQDLISGNTIGSAESLSIVIQLAHALAYCAERGLSAHQDLKPENILLDRLDRFRTSEGRGLVLGHRVKICDFGMANAFKEFGRASGSRPYMAPEQYGYPSTLAKADVFALGVILHELLTGGLHPIGEVTSDVWPRPLPAKGKKWTHEEIWKRWARHAKIADPARIPSAEITEIIKKCLVSDISARHSSASLEKTLCGILERQDRNVFENLVVNLNYFDYLAADGEIGGWPYYEQLLEQVNSYDYS